MAFKIWIIEHDIYIYRAVRLDHKRLYVELIYWCLLCPRLSQK